MEENLSHAPANEEARRALDGLRSHEGYLDDPFPSEADTHIAAVVERFACGEDAFRDALRASLTLKHYDALLTFAVRMAMLAVRERSTARLRLGLEAVAFAGEAPTADWRETSLSMLPLRDAARRLDADAREEFAKAARLARGGTISTLTGAVGGSTLIAGMERVAMRLGIGVWKAVNAPDGFRYVPTRRVTRAEVDDMIRRVEEARRSRPTGDDAG